ncbi:MAG: polyprenyl synthetase family protein [Bacteroidales bacterium]|nr:polyprenyl synthetase family protein [Bacteroidales bacterium]
MTIETRLEQVRAEYLRRMTRGNGSLLQQVERYVADRTGKMLRPRLLLAAAASRGAGALEERRTLLMAVAVEMLHNASLLHDDVVDRADTRRGRPSVNAQWNNAVAVLVGDYHLVQLMQLLDEADDRQATRLVNSTVAAMVEGELLQQQLLGGKALTEEDYLAVIDGKTARLFAAAALGNPACGDYGLHYGRLFQLLDDQADGEANRFTQPLIDAERRHLAALTPLQEMPPL